MTTDVELTNIGPIESITIPVPEDGGVVVFRGRNGSGKSLALAAIDSAVTGKGRVAVRDGQLKGQVQAHGITMTIGRSTRRKGELEVRSLEGKLSVADLVDPGIKDPEAADASRIKALVGLLGPGPDIGLFDVPDGIELSPATADATDLVDMASRVKREIEFKARAAEAAGENAKRDADAAKAAIGEDDPAWAKPVAETDAAMETAIEERATLKSLFIAGEAAADRATEARARLEATTRTGPTAAEAMRTRDDAMEAVRDAEAALAKAGQEAAASEKALQAATSYDNITRAWKADIDGAEAAETVTHEQLKGVDDAVEAARDESVKAAAGRRAANQTDKMANDIARQQTYEIEAELFRDAAKATDEVLSQIIQDAGTDLRVQAVAQRMRLVTNTDRGVTPFGELSPGERWRLALDIAAEAIGERGEITIPQDAWEAMDPANKAAIATHVRELGIIVYTAEATDGPLDATVYEQDSP